MLLSLLTGCGSEGEELSVPGSLCGVKVPQEALKPLLPAKGDSVDVNLRNYKDTFRHCNVGVGRHMVLIASLNRVPEFYDPMSTAAGVYNLEDPKRMPRLPFEKSAGATGSKDSMATVKCGGSGPAYLYLDLSTDPERLEADEQQHRADMRRFTIAYLKGSMKREGCAA